MTWLCIVEFRGSVKDTTDRFRKAIMMFLQHERPGKALSWKRSPDQEEG
jgi:hypothetical protein